MAFNALGEKCKCFFNRGMRQENSGNISGKLTANRVQAD
uniref:Uncharacterized protein n=1 Tax=Tetranychus urticae TaxID=32264 RepID=T1JRR0_TETUR